jgi:hypothetical protein
LSFTHDAVSSFYILLLILLIVVILILARFRSRRCPPSLLPI